MTKKTPSGDRLTALDSLISLLSPLCRASKSMHAAAENASDFFSGKDSKDGKEFLSDFDRAEKHLYGLIPDIETYVGRIISNHLLYESFPYVVGSDSPDTAFAAFVTAVGLLKILAVAGMAGSEKISDFVDILAFANRFIEHSNFYQICARLDHPSGMETYARFAPILFSAEK